MKDRKKQKVTELRHLTSKINVLGYIVSKTKSKIETKKRLSQMGRILSKAQEITESLKTL